MNITRDRRPRRRRLLFLLVFAWPAVARPPDLARAEAHTGLDSRLPLARGGFIATAHGSSAAHVLPAAMAYSPGKRTLAAAEFVDDRLSGGLAIWQRERIAVGYRHFDNRPPGDRDFDEDEYMATMAVGGGDRGAAAEARWIRNSLGGRPDALSFGASLSFLPNPRFAFAYRGEHLNRPHYLDGRLDDAHTVGLAVLAHDTFALATDVIFRDDGGDDFAIRYGFELKPIPVLRMAASVDNESHFEVSAGYNFRTEEEAGYGFRSTFDGGANRHAAYVGHDQQPPPTNRPPTRVPPPTGRPEQ